MGAKAHFSVWKKFSANTSPVFEKKISRIPEKLLHLPQKKNPDFFPEGEILLNKAGKTAKKSKIFDFSLYEWHFVYYFNISKKKGFLWQNSSINVHF